MKPSDTASPAASPAGLAVVNPLGLSAMGKILLMVVLVLAIMLGAMDRGSLSVAAPVLSRQMNLNPVQMGQLLSAFFWSYALLQAPGGWLADRFPVRWVLAAGVGVWSLATLASGFAHDPRLVFFARLLLGAGEAVLYPCLSKAIAGAFLPAERGLPNALIDAGIKVGTALGILVGGMLTARYGWPALFFVLGAASLLWLAPWMRWNRIYGRLSTAAPHSAAYRRDEGPGFIEILSRRDFWGATLGSCSFGYAYFFLLTWLPTYLVNERHMSLKTMAVLGSAPYWASALSSVIAGWASDKIIRSGASATLVRKCAVTVGLLASTVAMPSAFVADDGLSVTLLIIAYVALGLYGSNYWTISQILAGPQAAGKWVGLQNCLGGATGIAAPLVTGLIVAKTGSFQLAFVITAAISVIGASSYLLFMGEVEPLQWRRA